MRSSGWAAGVLLLAGGLSTSSVARANDGAFQAIGVSIGVRAGFVGRANQYGRMLPNSQIAPRVAIWGEWGGAAVATAGVSYQMGRHAQPSAIGGLMRNIQVDLGAKFDGHLVESGLQGSFSIWPDSDWYPSLALRFASVPEDHAGAEMMVGMQSQGLPQVAFSGVIMNPDLDESPIQVRQPPPR
ncbi:MAG: hypothetical protein AAFV53_30730 [Myxococcota bacterium]